MRSLSTREARELARRASRIAHDVERTTRGGRRPDASARRTRALIATLIFVALFALVALDRAGVLAPQNAGATLYDGASAQVERVIDGDTLIVDLIDPTTKKPTRVRLWGIDAPELAHDGQPAERLAEEAKRALVRLVEGRGVVLVIEPSRVRDRYGRVLAHVIAEDESVGATLVAQGLAESVERWRHRDTDRFEALELGAKRAHRGIWDHAPDRP